MPAAVFAGNLGRGSCARSGYLHTVQQCMQQHDRLLSAGLRALTQGAPCFPHTTICRSSRSHAIFTITLEQRRAEPAAPTASRPPSPARRAAAAAAGDAAAAAALVAEAAEEEEEEEDDEGDEGGEGAGEEGADDYLIAKMHLVDLVSVLPAMQLPYRSNVASWFCCARTCLHVVLSMCSARPACLISCTLRGRPRRPPRDPPGRQRARQAHRRRGRAAA